jgi:pyruvate dehydrogenase E2 component (dihydrolipoamide acetyltransferase)
VSGVIDFRLPDLGEGIHEAQVLRWRVRPGDHVEAFQPVVEVESAKATVELTSPATGRVAELSVQEGDTAQTGDLLLVIDPEPSADEPYFGIVGSPPPPAKAGPERRVLAAPFVRKLARELGLRLEDVPGSGPQGRVRVSDVEAAASKRPAAPADEEVVPLRGLRRRIADHMVESVRRAPQVTAMDLFDVTNLVQARDQLRPLAEAAGVRLTYLPFFVKACVEALRAVPDANAIVDEAAGALVRKRACHIGIATAVPDGLVVPVVKHAEQLSLLEIGREIARLVEAARARRSSPEQLSGGTFTITSFGGFRHSGSPLFATPILNHPEVAILGIGRVEQQPRVVDGAVVARACVGVSFTFDHRVLDGEAAGRFLAALRGPLENPLSLLLTLR